MNAELDSISFRRATAEVTPREGNNLLGGATGAYVGLIGIARSERHFEELAKRSLRALYCDTIGLTDIKELDRYNSIKDTLQNPNSGTRIAC